MPKRNHNIAAGLLTLGASVVGLQHFSPSGDKPPTTVEASAAGSETGNQKTTEATTGGHKVIKQLGRGATWSSVDRSSSNVLRKPITSIPPAITTAPSTNKANTDSSTETPLTTSPAPKKTPNQQTAVLAENRPYTPDELQQNADKELQEIMAGPANRTIVGKYAEYRNIVTGEITKCPARLLLRSNNYNFGRDEGTPAGFVKNDKGVLSLVAFTPDKYTATDPSQNSDVYPGAFDAVISVDTVDNTPNVSATFGDTNINMLCSVLNPDLSSTPNN
ncbi:MAG: hypothetical protein V4702_00960 [Patescibacteria group bacterium]